MAQRARVIIELEENFEDEVDEGTFEEYDEIDDLGDFAELVWQSRLEEINLDGQVMNIDCYQVED